MGFGAFFQLPAYANLCSKAARLDPPLPPKNAGLGPLFRRPRNLSDAEEEMETQNREWDQFCDGNNENDDG